jgi:uncharacterized protein (DUF4415 family)
MSGYNQRVVEGADIPHDPESLGDPGDAFWSNEVHWPRPKERVTVRFDQDVLEFFRREGKGYQTRMNAVLKAYIKASSR